MVLPQSRLKIRRARRHLEELERVIAEFVSGIPFEIGGPEQVTLRRGATGKEEKILLMNKFSVKPLPEMMPTILGDIVHNLRASLDIMACEIVRARGGNDNNVYFPFSEDRGGLEIQIKRKRFYHAGDDAVALLRSYEPHKGGNKMLRAIHDMDIADKHRTLLKQPQYETKILVWHSHDGAGNQIYPFMTLNPEALLSLTFIFNNDTVLAGEEVVPTLHKLIEVVEGIVEAFEVLVAVGPVN